MASAAGGDDSRLRIGGWLPDSDAPRIDGPVEGEVLRPYDLADDARGGWPMPARRTGPSVLPRDSWANDPERGRESESYHGRRRAAASPRLFLAVSVILVSVGAAIAIPLALRSGPDGAVPTGQGLDERGTTAGESSASISPAPSPTPVPSVSASPTVVAAPAFRPTTYEAEAPPPSNTRGGTARVRNTQGASRKKIVSRIGDWSESDSTEANNGTLRFNAVTAPAAGTYLLTIYYAFVDDEADESRSATITVNGAASTTVTFAAPNGCCAASARIAITLRRGANAILFANAVGHAPAIDRIVITRP